MGRYIWAISCKKDNLWIKWISEIYVKNRDWWNYIPSGGCSWYWRKICEVKDQLRRIIDENDLKQMHQYSVRDIYKRLMGVQDRVHWDKYAWSRLAVPKHRFFMWLVLNHRLQTIAMLYRYGISNSPRCLICGAADETQDHLLFTCCYSERILMKIKKWLEVNTTLRSVPSLINWIGRCRRSKFQKNVIATAVAWMVYHIWGVRNEVYCDSKVQSVHITVNRIQRAVIDRVYGVLP